MQKQCNLCDIYTETLCAIQTRKKIIDNALYRIEFLTLDKSRNSDDKKPKNTNRWVIHAILHNENKFME